MFVLPLPCVLLPLLPTRFSARARLSQPCSVATGSSVCLQLLDLCGVMAVCGPVHAGVAHVVVAMDTLLTESPGRLTR